jgi:hypothetical protein
MSSPKRIRCEYCSTSNPWEASTCQACGASIIPPKNDLEPQKISIQPTQTSSIESEDIQDAVDKADQAYLTILNTYAIAWRTVGEAISIGVTGLILGFSGGVTDLIFPGVLGAILVGLTVGFSRKQFFLVIISAPAGLFVGMVIGMLIWLMGSQPQVIVYTGLVFATLGAILGSKRNIPFRQHNCWEKARPVLGAFGGFLFGLFGAFLGWGVREIVDTVSNFL